MKKIFSKLLAVWALIIFVISLLVFFPLIWGCGLWKEPKRSHLLQPIFQAWMKVFFTLTGVRRTIKGKNQFRTDEAFIIVCNHKSLLDPPISSPGIPEANKTIAKFEMAGIPVFGIIYKRGSVLVDRKSEESRKKSYVRMKEVLAMGLHMCIYPEGTRNRSDIPLQRFHDGAFRLSVETGNRIVPAVIFHSAKVLPASQKFYFWPHPIEMHFLDPVSPEGKSTVELREEVFQIMWKYLEEKQERS